MTRSRAALALVACLLVAMPAAGQQPDVEEQLDRAKALYRDGRLEEAAGALRAVITRLNQARELQDRTQRLADAHFHLGLAQLAMREDSAAIDSFRQVVAIDPERRLDPAIYAPKVLEAYEQARDDIGAARATQPLGEARGQPLPVPVPAELRRADRPLAVVPGAKIRLRRSDSGSALHGQFLAIDDATLTVGGDQWRVAVPLDTVQEVQVVRAQKNHWLAGMLIGAGAGVLIGALETPGCTGDGDCYTRAENMGYGGFGAGLVGGLIGALYRTDVWVDVSVTRDRPAARPQSALRVAFTWRY